MCGCGDCLVKCVVEFYYVFDVVCVDVGLFVVE